LRVFLLLVVQSLNGPGGFTPVHLAVEADQPATLAVLVDAGCAVSKATNPFLACRVGDAGRPWVL
jgi:hypothetical protein